MRIFPRKNQPVLAYVLGFGFVALAGQANAGCLSGLAESAAPSKSSTPSAPAELRPRSSKPPIGWTHRRRLNSCAPRIGTMTATTTSLSSDCGSSC